jgi:hypothetical protein
MRLSIAGSQAKKGYEINRKEFEMFRRGIGWISNSAMVASLLVAWGCSSSAGVKPTRPIALDVETPPPAEIGNIGDLKLEVLKADIETNISESGVDAPTRTLSPKEGYNLVVVTLTGHVTAPCRCTFEAREFAAVYTEKDGSETNTEIRISEAIGDEDRWDIPSEGASVCSGWYFYKPGKATFRVAFTLPKDVSKFTVRCPTTAKNLADLTNNK